MNAEETRNKSLENRTIAACIRHVEKCILQTANMGRFILQISNLIKMENSYRNKTDGDSFFFEGILPKMFKRELFLTNGLPPGLYLCTERTNIIQHEDLSINE